MKLDYSNIGDYSRMWGKILDEHLEYAFDLSNIASLMKLVIIRYFMKLEDTE